MRRLFLFAILLACMGRAFGAGQAIKELRGHRAAVYAVAFRPDGERMASASFDHTIKVWDVDSGRVVRTFPAIRTKCWRWLTARTAGNSPRRDWTARCAVGRGHGGQERTV